MKTIILSECLSAIGIIRRMLKSVGSGSQVRVLDTYDEFSFGPLSNMKSPKEFFALRQEYWQPFPIPYCLPLQFDTHCKNIEEIRKYDRVEFWSTATVQSQFFVITMLHLFEMEDIDPSTLRIRNLPLPHDRLGLDGVSESEIKKMWQNLVATNIEFDLYHKAWGMISTGNNDEIADYSSELPQGHPLSLALDAYLMRFPDHCRGLGSIERALLACCSDRWQKSRYPVGNAMAFGKPDLDSIRDHNLFQRLKELETNQGWVQFRGDTAEMRDCAVRLTPSGNAIIERFGITPLS